MKNPNRLCVSLRERQLRKKINDVIRSRNAHVEHHHKLMAKYEQQLKEFEQEIIIEREKYGK